MINFELLTEGIQKCKTCSFYNSAIMPLTPSFVTPPVPIMFIGENPSWADGQNQPFAESTISGKALYTYYLEPLGLIRTQVWITDLFKCRYPKNIYHNKSEYEQLIQANAEKCSQKWLAQEISIAHPKIIVTLSDKQVFQRLRHAFNLSIPKKFNLTVGKPHQIEINGWKTILFPMVHPDISRPLSEGDSRKLEAREKWAHIHENVHIPKLKKLLELV